MRSARGGVDPDLPDPEHAIRYPQRVDRDRINRPVPPLLAPASQAAVVGGLLSTPVDSSELDLSRLVDRLAAGVHVHELPRRSRLSLLKGADVLVDLGSAMSPYAADTRQLVALARVLAGQESVRMQGFFGSPLVGAGVGPSRFWQPYEVPSPRAVLVLSDLGCSGFGEHSAGVSEWLQFAELLRDNACVPIALTPYPDSIHPRLAKRFGVVAWDRRTTAGEVIRRVRELEAGR